MSIHCPDSVLVVSGMGQAMITEFVFPVGSQLWLARELPMLPQCWQPCNSLATRWTLHKLFPLPTSFLSSIKFLHFLPSSTQILLQRKLCINPPRGVSLPHLGCLLFKCLLLLPNVAFSWCVNMSVSCFTENASWEAGTGCFSSLCHNHLEKYFQIPYKHGMKEEREEDGRMEGRKEGMEGG